MPDLKPKFGSATSLTTTGLSTLANGASATSDALDLTSLLGFDVAVTLKFTTDSGATSGSLVRVFAKLSVDGTDYTTDAQDYPMGVVILPAAGIQTPIKTFSIGAAFPGGIIPAFAKVRVQQDTGAAFTDGTLVRQVLFAQSV